MDEKELIRLSREGHREAFSDLVAMYKTKVFSLAFGLTRNREVADDLAQEIFTKAYFSLPSFRQESRFGTWLYRIAMNHIKDFLRKAKLTRREVPLDEIREQALIEDNERERTEKEHLEEKQRELVHRVLRTLPPKYRVILALRDIQGVSYEEIAKILKISAGTVDSRLYRARKLLRRRLEPFLSRGGRAYEMQKG